MQGNRDSGAARLNGVGGRSSGEGLPFRVGKSPRAGCPVFRLITIVAKKTRQLGRV